jgi:hypothetical protein
VVEAGAGGESKRRELVEGEHLNAGTSTVINSEDYGIKRYPHMREMATESYLIRASMLACWTRAIGAHDMRVVICYVGEGGLHQGLPALRTSTGRTLRRSKAAGLNWIQTKQLGSHHRNAMANRPLPTAWRSAPE